MRQVFQVLELHKSRIWIFEGGIPWSRHSDHRSNSINHAYQVDWVPKLRVLTFLRVPRSRILHSFLYSYIVWKPYQYVGKQLVIMNSPTKSTFCELESQVKSDDLKLLIRFHWFSNCPEGSTKFAIIFKRLLANIQFHQETEEKRKKTIVR